MANVAFRRGNKANLPQSAVDGVFYYTRDTHKLYIGDGTTMVDLSHFINYVNTQANLPSVADDGDMYYIKNDNILCIRDSNATGGWTQINPDTRLTDSNNAVIASNHETSGTVDGVTITTTVTDTGATANTATGNFSIIAGSNFHISRDGNVLTFSSDNSADDHIYRLNTEANSTTGATVKLTETLNGTETSDSTSILFKGAGDVTVSSSGSTGTGANTVTISVPEHNISNSLAFGSDGKLTSNAELTTGAQASSYVTPTIKYGKPATSGGTQPESAVFVSGDASLDVYTTGQVDALLTGVQASMDAMTYKGAVTPSQAQTLLAGTAGKVGDTYKVSQTFTYGSGANAEEFKAGDLIIAKGTDDNVTWDHVPSGDDQLVGGAVNSAYFQVEDRLATQTLLKVNLSADIGNANTSTDGRALINVVGSVVSAGSNGVGAEATYKFVHGDAGTGTAVAQVNGTGTSMTAHNPLTEDGLAAAVDVHSVSSISKDAAGHVTSVTMSKYVIQDTHNQIDDVAAGAAVDSNNVATLTVSVTNTDGDSDSGAFTLKTSGSAPGTNGGIQFSQAQNAPAGELYIDFVWGSF